MIVGHLQIDDFRGGIVAKLRANLADRGDEVRRRRIEIPGGIFQIGRPRLLQFGFRLANLAGGIGLIVPIGLYQAGHGNPLLRLAVGKRQDFEFLSATDVLVRPISLRQFQCTPLQLIGPLRPIAQERLRPNEETALDAGLRNFDHRLSKIDGRYLLLVRRQT